MRIDMAPTDVCGGFRIRPGIFLDRGARIVPGGISFSVYSSTAKSCTLVLFHNGERDPFALIPYPESYRIGNVFAMIVFDLNDENLEYGFYMEHDGEHAGQCLLDPYAKLISGRDVWGKLPEEDEPFPYRGRVARDDFEWEGDCPLRTPAQELIIYEAHVRGFTKHASSKVKYPGTYAGLREKIPYLKDLGITAIELLPIFEFDEFDGRKNADGVPYFNYWGYSTVGFFAPKAGYAASGKYSLQMEELKTLVKLLHQNGIKVILDVVFNHTAEGDETGPCISFKGIDKKTYYILTPDGRYYNFSGCGNTMNCNHPVVRDMIIACLRYWIAEYHVDGFRFDLASILGRSQDGAPMANPPLLEMMAYDPLLKDAVLIAEAWDAGGLYQVGSFPSYGRWMEWNGRYRDDLRRFLRGEEGLAASVAARITGSEDIYDRRWRGDVASINFITCHDGFTLWDLYSYNEKHNAANGWNDTDGSNDNFSWNCGQEGDTRDPEILRLRRRLVKNAAAVLFTSVGIPMLLAGDEFGNSQQGNNNAYCQDSELSWLDWSLLEKNRDIYAFFRHMIAFRKAHPMLQRMSKGVPAGYPPISLHGTQAWHFDYSGCNRVIGVMFAGRCTIDGEERDDFVYLGINAHWEAHRIQLPGLPKTMQWQVVVDTMDEKHAFHETPESLKEGESFLLGPRAVMVCASQFVGS